MSQINLAEAYLNLGQTDQAFELLDRAAKIGENGFPTPQRTFYDRILGRAYLQDQRYKEALVHFQLSYTQEYKHTNDRLHSLLGQSYAYLGLAIRPVIIGF